TRAPPLPPLSASGLQVVTVRRGELRDPPQMDRHVVGDEELAGEPQVQGGLLVPSGARLHLGQLQARRRLPDLVAGLLGQAERALASRDGLVQPAGLVVEVPEVERREEPSPRQLERMYRLRVREVLDGRARAQEQLAGALQVALRP